MYTEKFLQQVHRKLIEVGITNAKLRDTCIEIFEGENEIFKIDRNREKNRTRRRHARHVRYVKGEKSKCQKEEF